MTQDNAISPNYDRAKIGRTIQNSKCRLCHDKEETIRHILTKCIKSAQKEKNDETLLCVEGGRFGIVKETEISPYKEMVSTQLKIHPGE